VLFALSPFAVFYAQEVRPYSLLMFLGIMSWYFTHCFFYVAPSLPIQLGMMASTLFFLYSHGAGFLLLLSLTSYAVLYLIGDFHRWKLLLRWALLQMIIVVLYIPWLLRARAVRMGHAAIPDWEDITTTLFTVIFGYGEFTWLPGWIPWISVGLITIVLLTLGWHTIPRAVSVSFVSIPIVFAIVISYVISPIWLPRTLAYIFPFWCLSLSLTLAIALDRHCNSRKKHSLLPHGFFALCSILLLALSIHQQRTFYWLWDIKDASTFVSANLRADDIIFIPDKRLFWVWGWYYAGPGTVNPLTTNYLLTINERVHAVSSSTIQDFIETDRTYWHIYRPNIDPSSYLSSMGNVKRKLIVDFRGLTVEKIQFTGK